MKRKLFALVATVALAVGLNVQPANAALYPGHFATYIAVGPPGYPGSGCRIHVQRYESPYGYPVGNFETQGCFGAGLEAVQLYQYHELQYVWSGAAGAVNSGWHITNSIEGYGQFHDLVGSQGFYTQSACTVVWFLHPAVHYAGTFCI